MWNLDNNTNSQFGNSEAGALQLEAKGQYQVEPNIHIDKIKSTIKDVLTMGDFPEDKKVEITIDYMVVPRAMNITISKK